ncbi:MAG: glycosyltransferase, partial [Endomicrobiia bacterium]
KICSLGVKIYHLDMPTKTSLLTFFLLPYSLIKFFYLILKYKPQIVHSFLFQANFLSRFVKVVFPKTKIFCSERVVEKEKLWQIKFLRFTDFLVDKIWTNSNETKEFVIKEHKFNEKKIVISPNMIDLNDIKIKFSSSEIKKELALKEGDFLVVSVGRLHRQKGYDLLIEIAKSFSGKIKYKNFRYLFAVIGDGEEYEDLLNYTKKLQVEDYVKFLGYKENVYDYINACDLFLLTSYWEGSPNVVLEALALKKIVVSTKVEGVSEILNSDYLVNLNQERKDIIDKFVEKIYDVYKNKYDFKVCLNQNFDFYKYLPEFVIKEKFLYYYIDKNYYIL